MKSLGRVFIFANLEICFFSFKFLLACVAVFLRFIVVVFACLYFCFQECIEGLARFFCCFFKVYCLFLSSDIFEGFVCAVVREKGWHAPLG